jgi:hypothetical protein
MEAINNASKAIAKAKKLIDEYLLGNDIENDALLLDASVILGRELEKITEIM